jgi:hypothetical protein
MTLVDSLTAHNSRSATSPDKRQLLSMQRLFKFGRFAVHCGGVA